MIEAGLLLFDDINKQARNKPYYNANLKEWICPTNRYLPFQFRNLIVSNTITSFDIINVDTGVTTDKLVYFDANTTRVFRIGWAYYSHLGDVSVVTAPGRYYFYIQDAGGYEWWSEVFTVTDVTE